MITHFLKNPNLDITNLNFCPKLPFLSKILEKIVFNQLYSFVSQNNILDKFQSGFRVHHCTESALLKVSNDLLLALDSGKSAILMLLDLSSAFDSVDHAALLNCLRDEVGIKGTALDWFSSYLSDRSVKVMIGNSSSPSAPLIYGVPQGSLLGAIIFCLYMLTLGSIMRKYIIFHSIVMLTILRTTFILALITLILIFLT